MGAANDKNRAHDRPPLNRKRVLRAALRLADEAGIDALTMRRLGQELGVQAMSLYNHVANKDDILDGLVEETVEEIVGEIDAPPAQGVDWRAALRRRAISARNVLLRHPWATHLIVSRINIGPMMLGYVDRTIGTLRQAGFSIAMVDHAWNAIDSYIYGFTLQKLNFPIDPTEYADAAAGYLPQLSDTEHPHLREMTKAVAERRHDGMPDFEFGLDLILDGLGKIADAPRSRDGP